MRHDALACPQHARATEGHLSRSRADRARSRANRVVAGIRLVHERRTLTVSACAGYMRSRRASPGDRWGSVSADGPAMHPPAAIHWRRARFSTPPSQADRQGRRVPPSAVDGGAWPSGWLDRAAPSGLTHHGARVAPHHGHETNIRRASPPSDAVARLATRPNRDRDRERLSAPLVVSAFARA